MNLETPRPVANPTAYAIRATICDRKGRPPEGLTCFMRSIGEHAMTTPKD